MVYLSCRIVDKAHFKIVVFKIWMNFIQFIDLNLIICKVEYPLIRLVEYPLRFIVEYPLRLKVESP